MIILIGACVIIVRHTEQHVRERSPRAGIVPLIYAGVLELSFIQEAVFYPA